MSNQYITPFSPDLLASTNNIAVTATSQTLAIPGFPNKDRTLRVVNSGTQLIFIRYVDTSTEVATSTVDIPLLANTGETFTVPKSKQFVAVIAGSTGSTMYLTVGTGI